MGSFFGSVVTAMVTPFTSEGEVDYDEAVRLARYLLSHGTDTVLLAGTTGESPTLTHEEEYRLFSVIVESTKGLGKVMAGTGSNSTRTAIESSKKAQDIGVDGLLQVVPYYNKPSQEGLYQHFSTIASETDLPIMLYNIPGRTSKNMEPETISRLAEIPSIVALKEAAGDVDQFQKIHGLVPNSFSLYSGDDALTLPFLERGGCGVVSVGSHLVGEKIQEMIASFQRGETEKAQTLSEYLAPLFDALFITSNPVPLKAALRMKGFQVGSVRLPLVDVTQDESLRIKEVLEKMSLLEPVLD